MLENKENALLKELIKLRDGKSLSGNSKWLEKHAKCFSDVVRLIYDVPYITYDTSIMVDVFKTYATPFFKYEPLADNDYIILYHLSSLSHIQICRFIAKVAEEQEDLAELILYIIKIYNGFELELFKERERYKELMTKFFYENQVESEKEQMKQFLLQTYLDKKNRI